MLTSRCLDEKRMFWCCDSEGLIEDNCYQKTTNLFKKTQNITLSPFDQGWLHKLSKSPTNLTHANFASVRFEVTRISCSKFTWYGFHLYLTHIKEMAYRVMMLNYTKCCSLNEYRDGSDFLIKPDFLFEGHGRYPPSGNIFRKK